MPDGKKTPIPGVNVPMPPDARVEGVPGDALGPDPYGATPEGAENVYQRYSGVMMPAVAGVPPERIESLRLAGKALLERLRAAQSRGSDTLGAPLLDALEYAQQRWPRVFGHAAGVIGDRTGRAPGAWGSSAPAKNYLAKPAPGKAWKFSEMYFEPGMTASKAYETVGHEMSHSADRIRWPDMDQRYAAESARPGGYDTNVFEYRARNQGDNMLNERSFQLLNPPEDPRAGQRMVRKNRIRSLKESITPDYTEK